MDNIFFLFRRGELGGKGTRSSLLIPALVHNSEEMPTEKMSVWSLIRSSNKIILFAWFILAGVPIYAQFSGGSGTIADPYLISNFTDLATISSSITYWNQHFKQTANIDASTSSSLNSGAGFLPIANPTTKFTGTYLGQNYKITDLVVNRSSTSSVGLFGEVSGATIKDLKLVGAKITGSNNVGGFAGWAGANTTLQNLSIDITSMIVGADDVGGIVGEADNTAVTDCSSWASVDGNNTTGGLIGFCDFDGTSKSVTNCFAAGIVTGDGNRVGGLIGENQQTVTNCYSTGKVSASGTRIGGLIGSSSGKVENCYSTSEVRGDSDVGGLIGYSSAAVSDCFALGSVTGNDDTGGLIGYQISGGTVTLSYAAVRVINITDSEVGGLIGDNAGSETKCFWIDLYNDDNALLPDEDNSTNSNIKVVSNQISAAVAHPLSALRGSNAVSTMTDFNFADTWQIATTDGPGTFPVLRNLTVPLGAPIGPTGFVVNGVNSAINLEWDANVETDIASYRLYRSTTINFTPSPTELLATIPDTTTGRFFYSDSGAGSLAAPQNGTLYHYVLVAVDTDGNISLPHRGSTIPGINLATVSVSIVSGGITYTDSHGNISPDVYAVFSDSTGGNITNTNSIDPDGCGDEQGVFHSRSVSTGNITITPSGLQNGQKWYFFYDDNTVSGYPVRNFTGGAGSGTTLVTGTGNTPITITSGLDGNFTDYLFYVDVPPGINREPLITGLTDSSICLNDPFILDADLVLYDSNAAILNAGYGNYNGFQLIVQRRGGGNIDDLFSFLSPGTGYVVGMGTITLGGEQIATFTNSSGTLDIQFMGTEVIPTQVTANAIARSIAYDNNVVSSFLDTVELDWIFKDGLLSDTSTQKVILKAPHTVSAASSAPALCINTLLTTITHTTTGATGIGTATGLPAGVSASWASNTITISGTPTAAGTFNYVIPLTGGCNSVNATGSITVTPGNTVGAASSTPTLCINNALTNITHTTTGVLGIGTATGLPAGVTASWASNTITISGTPTASGTFTYSIPLMGGCGIVNASGTIIVTQDNTVGAASSTPTLCINTALTDITHTTTGAAGIGTSTGLPAGITASWASNTITISGTPTASGTFTYSIPLTGGCGTVNATGTITVVLANTASAASSSPTLCINTPLLAITHATTAATGIGTASGLPAGVTASWASNTITISGTPTVSGTFTYTIPLTGGCGTVNASGTITVTPDNTVGAASSTPSLCINSALTAITHTTTGAAGIGTSSGLPAGVTAAWASNTITISGTPTVAGTFNYTIPLTGGCGSVNAIGTITVNQNTASVASSAPTLCINTVLTDITHTTTGATGIGTPTGLPAGVTASWASNTITISGTPTANGLFNYIIPLNGGCGSVNAMGTITVVLANTASAASSTPTLYTNTPLTAITHTTTVATGIGAASGLPAGVTASWASNTITISGTPTASGTFTYTIPLTGGCGTVNASGTITVTPQNPFTPDPDVNITYVNVLTNGSVATNDDVPTGATYGNPTARSTNPSGGVLVLQPNGTYTFKSENPGVYYYEIEVCEPGQTTGCSTRILKIAVTQIGDFEVNPPIANFDIAYTLKNTNVILKTTANDTAGMISRSLDRSSITLIISPTNGMATVNTSTGDITYSPNNNFVGIERYTYKICDNGSIPLCDTAIQEIYIFDSGIPNTTQAADDYFTTYGSTKVTGSVITNDVDPQGHPTTVTPLTSDIEGIGKLVLLASGSFEFEPDGNFIGPVSFVYDICDNQTPNACAKATLYFLVKPQPKPTPDYNMTYVRIKIEETDADVATNDILPPAFLPLYTLKAAIPGNPSDSLPKFNANKRGKYTFITNVKGLYEFDVYVCPSIISIPSDLCLLSRLTINVLDFESPLNPPIALPDFAATRKNVAVTLETMVNDASGNSGGVLDISSVSIIKNGRYGSGVVNGVNGNIQYTPLNNYVGYDTLTYKVCEQGQSTLCDTTYQIIEINPVSDPNFVKATDDHVSTFANRPVSGNVITNDSDPEMDNLSVNDSTYTWSNKGTIVLNTNGSYVFTPVKSFYGLLSFIYDLCDDGSPQACSKATLYILVRPVSLPSPDINATYVNKNLFGDVSTNDRFIPGTTYSILNALPSNPSTILPSMTNKGYYTFLSFVPGTFLFNVELCPPFASGFGCELTQLKIDVLKVADSTSNVPVAHTDITMTMFNTSVTIPSLVNDRSGLENGKLDSAQVQIIVQPDSGVANVSILNGDITYIPNATFFGNDTITYKVCELNKPTLCATAIQVITVLEPNAANNTSAADDYYITKAGVPVSGQILLNDRDPEGHGKGVADNSLRTPIILADQLSWKVSLRSLTKILDTTVTSVGRFEILNDGTFTFTPIPTFFGPYNLPYQQCDMGTPVACARATIYVLVNPPASAVIPSGPVACVSDVNINLNQTCQYFVPPNMVLLGDVGNDLSVKINDSNPTNGAVLDGVSPSTVGWLYSVYRPNGDFICSGKIYAFDKSKPEVTKPNDVNLICDAVNKVQDVPASWLNTSYQFFTGQPTNVYDNCSGPLSLKVTDILSYTNCAVDNIYAVINRSFRYTDKFGNDSVVTHKINFRRPINSVVSSVSVNTVGLGNFGPLGANVKFGNINGQVDQNAKVGSYYAANKKDTLIFNSCGAPTSSTEIRSYLRDAYKYDYLIDTSTYRRDTAYLFDDLCNYKVSFTYNTFLKCNNGSHIQALVSIMDGCTNAILIDTLSLIFQDTIAPQFIANSTQLNGIQGSLENAPVQMNASIQSCSGSIRLPSNADMNGWILSSHFNVKVSDNCNGSQVSFSYKLETKNNWSGFYVPRSTWVEDGYVAMPMPDQSIVYNNLPIGEHRLIVSAFDQCANTGLDTFYFNLVDNTPPVMACKDKLNVSITSNSSDNWYLNGRYANSLYPGEGEKSAGRVYVSDINEGSRDNCRLDSLYVRRMFTSSCLDFLKLNMIYDQFGLNPNGVVDIADFEPVAGKPDTYWTPRGMPYIEIFCCDLSVGNKEIMVELWGRDGGALPFASSQSAWNYCWSVINIEDKSAPVITKVDYALSGNAGKKNWIYCTDKEAIKAVQQEDLSVLRFGFPSIFGLECNGKVTYSSREKLHCDTGLIYRTWVVEKEIKPGMVVTVSYTDSIFVLAHHKYTITVPTDVVTDCADQGGQSIPGVSFDEDGCDLLAISMSPDRIYDRDVKGGQCKTIYRTSTVINWCQVPNQFQCSNAADPMLFATVLPRNTSGIAQVYQFEKKMVSPPSVVSHFVNGPMIVNALGSSTNIFNALLKLNPGCSGTLGEQSFAWQYTQIILVKDTVAPVIGADYIAPDFGVSSQNQCLAAGKIAFKVTDNCTSSPLWLEKAVIYEKNGQIAVGKVNTLLPLSFTGSMEVSVSDLTAGVSAAKQYELLVTVRDGCGVSSTKRLPFSVSVKAAPAIVCIQTLTTSLMKTDDNQAMQRIRAIDFFQDITRDRSAGACSPVVAVGISRDMNVSFSADSSVVVTCNDIGVIPVKVFLKDAYGNISFCPTFIEVEDNAKFCPASNILNSSIAGVIRTVNKLPIPKVSMKLAGHKDRELSTNDKGIYTFEELPNGFDYTVKPTLDKDHLNGVSTFDLILITKHILGLKPLETPHQLIAADINRSGSISTLDLIQLRKLILNVAHSFPNNTSWRFIREGYIFPNLGNLWTNNFPEIFNLNNLKSHSYGNFVGIKIGDVSGNVNPSNAVSSVIRSDKKAVPLNVMVKSLANGQFQCTFFIPYQEQPDGFQFTLQWANGLSLVNVLPNMLENEHIGTFIPENMLTFSWNGDKKEGELITLTFQTPDGKWSNDYLSLTNRLTPIEAYLEDETVGMKLTFPAVNNTDEAALLQNYPNPFHEVTNLPFYLPEAGEVVIEISNLSGGLVKVIKADYSKGIHQVSIGKKDLQTAGVYLATMKYKSQKLINKLVMVNN